MWCCKRLDASDWPVTSVVRGNVSCLHVATAASLTSETPVGLLFRDFLSPSFSLSLSFSLFFFLAPSFSLVLTNSSSASYAPFRFSAAPLPPLLLYRTKKEGEGERLDGEFAYLCEKGPAGDRRRSTVSMQNGSSGRRPARVLLEFWRDTGTTRDAPRDSPLGASLLFLDD